MAGGRDLIIVTIPADAALTEQEYVVGKRQLTLGRIDAPFRIRIGDPGNPRGWVQATGWTFCDPAETVDRIYVTIDAADATGTVGDVIELWCTDGSDVQIAP